MLLSKNDSALPKLYVLLIRNMKNNVCQIESSPANKKIQTSLQLSVHLEDNIGQEFKTLKKKSNTVDTAYLAIEMKAETIEKVKNPL